MATTKPKGKPLGPRVTVVFGKVTTGKRKGQTMYTYMLKSTADYFGFKAAPKAVGKKPKKGQPRLIRGSKGGGSIKVAMKRAGTAKGGKSVTRFRSIPVPPGATLQDCQKFLQGASKNKPESFASKDGQTYPVAAKK